jgi:hypothetical protein
MYQDLKAKTKRKNFKKKVRLNKFFFLPVSKNKKEIENFLKKKSKTKKTHKKTKKYPKNG